MKKSAALNKQADKLTSPAEIMSTFFKPAKEAATSDERIKLNSLFSCICRLFRQSLILPFSLTFNMKFLLTSLFPVKKKIFLIMYLLKSLLKKGLSKKILVPSDKRFIFLYHDVSNSDSPQYSEHYSTKISAFHNHIEFFSKHFKFVSLDEIISADHGEQERLAAITFDDGFLSVKTEILPYLKERGIPFTVFLNTSAVKTNSLKYKTGNASIERSYETKVYLDENDVWEISEQGVLIGSHTANHKVLSECAAAELGEEISDAKHYLETLVKYKIKHLALPFGKREHYNDAVLKFCRNAGHEYIYSTNPVFFDRKYLNASRLIPRIGLTNESVEELYFYINRPLVKTINI